MNTNLTITLPDHIALSTTWPEVRARLAPELTEVVTGLHRHLTWCALTLAAVSGCYPSEVVDVRWKPREFVFVAEYRAARSRGLPRDGGADAPEPDVLLRAHILSANDDSVTVHGSSDLDTGTSNVVPLVASPGSPFELVRVGFDQIALPLDCDDLARQAFMVRIQGSSDEGTCRVPSVGPRFACSGAAHCNMSDTRSYATLTTTIVSSFSYSFWEDFEVILNGCLD